MLYNNSELISHGIMGINGIYNDHEHYTRLDFKRMIFKQSALYRSLNL